MCQQLKQRPSAHFHFIKIIPDTAVYEALALH
jgi:hypothetical protein